MTATAWRAAVEDAHASLREAVPYINRALNPNDPDNAPWRIETAEGVMQRLRAVAAMLEHLLAEDDRVRL